MKHLLLIPLLTFGLWAQGTPNCSQALSFTGATAGASINTISGAAAGCAGWRLTWSVTGFTAVTVQLEGSQDNSTWNAFGSTLVQEGTNPTNWTASTASNTIVVRASLPYVRVNITGATGSGTIKTTILGYSGTSAQLDTGGGGGGGGGGASTSGGGSLGYSASNSFTSGTTYYLPPVGGEAASTTEANVQGLANVTAPIANLFVQVTAAPGTGNSLVFTFRDAGASQSVTCTIANSATSCSDTAHNFTPAANDLIDVQMVDSGVTATIGIVITYSYGIQFVSPDILSEYKTLGGTLNSAKAEYQTVAASGSFTILNYTGGSPGYISSIFLGIINGDGLNGVNLSNITITVDGEGTPAINTTVGRFFGAEYLGAATVGSFTSRYLGGNTNNGNTVTYYSFIPIPFKSSVKVVYTNGSSTTSTSLFATIGYLTGVPDTWPNTRKLWVSSGLVAAATPNQVLTLVNATSLNPGRLFGVYTSIDGVPGTVNPAGAMLEGNVKIYVDGAGSPNFESSGTEDYYMMGAYFQGTGTSCSLGTSGTCPGPNTTFSPRMSGDYVGAPFIAPANTTAQQTFNAFRFHVADPITFTNAIKVTFNCGDTSEVNFTGTARYAYTVWYYTQ